MRNNIERGAASAVLLLCMIFLIFSPAQAGENTVRVGYMDYPGFIEEAANGDFQGYGAAYLEKIARYAGWKYEYVFGTWSEILEQLKAGDLDMVCTAQYTDERAEIYDYSSLPIGYETAALYTRYEDSDIFYRDYAALEGKSIGLLAGSYQNIQLDAYEEEHALSLRRVCYDTDKEMLSALKNREVDLILTGSLALHRELKLVDQFGSEPFYIITSKGNERVLGPVDEALNQIKTFFPYFEQELYQEYYGADVASSVPPFTREEHEFIKASGSLTVGVCDGYAPLVLKDPGTGAADGMLPAIIKKISNLSGLSLTCVLVDRDTPVLQQLETGQVDLVLCNPYADPIRSDPDLRISDALTDEALVMMTVPSEMTDSQDGLLAAIPLPFTYLKKGLEAYFPGCEIRYYDTVKESIDAVVSGQADITVQNNYIANYYLQRRKYQSMAVSSFLNYSDVTALASHKNTDARLMSIINKSILCIPQDARTEIVTNYTIGMPYQESAGEVFWYYRYQIAVIAALGLVLIVVTMLLLARRTKLKVIEKEAENYRRLSERDVLTGVYNRGTFYQKARQLLDENLDTVYQFIYLNVENFKLINDLYGTGAGDELLCRIAAWAKQYSHRIDGIAGRLDADHFVLCVPKKADHGELVMRLLRKELESSPVVGMRVIVNCGVYEARDRTKKIQLMCDRAHLASNDSKGNVMRPVTYYSDSHREHLMQVQAVLNEMASALAEGQFQIYLQPQVQIHDGSLSGAEALVRWIHPKRGMIAPNQFIPIFESNGFITRLDLYVYEEVCKLLKRWKEEGRKLIPISVNLSRVDFYDNTLRERLISIAERYEVDRNYLELELTESAYSENTDGIYDSLRQLQFCGFKVLMDDFGSGYSALNMLKDAPVDILKLDLRFLYKSDPYHRSWQILNSIISMADALHIPVIAEGVETKEQVEALGKTTCRYAQGYFYSRPIAVDEFEKNEHFTSF